MYSLCTINDVWNGRQYNHSVSRKTNRVTAAQVGAAAPGGNTTFRLTYNNLEFPASNFITERVSVWA